MGIKYEVTAANGTYTDKNGTEKTRWLKCGVVLEKKDGSLSLKLEALPVSGFNGWLNLWEPKAEKTSTRAPGKKTGTSFDDMEDDIPFK